MHVSKVIIFGLLALVSSALAAPRYEFSTTPDAATLMLEKRQVGGGGGGGGGGGSDEEPDLDRPSEWNDLPRLEPSSLRETYKQHVQLETLALLSGGDPALPFRLSLSYAYHRFTYLLPGQLFEDLRELAPLIRAEQSFSRVFEQKMSELDVPTLEQQLEGLVAFRQEHERLGSPGQERWRYPLLRRPEDPVGLLSPFDSLTVVQDRLLIATKARDGMTDPSQLSQYIRSRDPFLFGDEDIAALVVENALSDYGATPDGFSR